MVGDVKGISGTIISLSFEPLESDKDDERNQSEDVRYPQDSKKDQMIQE